MAAGINAINNTHAKLLPSIFMESRRETVSDRDNKGKAQHSAAGECEEQNCSQMKDLILKVKATFMYRVRGKEER